MAAYQIEQEAIMAPTSVRSQRQMTGIAQGVTNPTSVGDVDQVAALARVLARPGQSASGVQASVGQALLGSQQPGDTPTTHVCGARARSRQRT